MIKRVKTYSDLAEELGVKRITVFSTPDQLVVEQLTMSKADFEAVLERATDLGWAACEQYYLDIEMKKLKKKECPTCRGLGDRFHGYSCPQCGLSNND